VSKEALPVALAYVLGGLVASGHVAATAHHCREGYLPANLYMLGPPFPSAGKNRVEVARKEHNTRLAADAVRNSVSSAK
jgi:hypothetical protein